MFLELGLHYDWKFGSIPGMLHQSLLTNETDYENATEGHEIMVTFKGNTENVQLLFDEGRERGTWQINKSNNFIGTI